MFGINLTDYDKKVYEEKLADFLPDKIVDCHIHLSLLDQLIDDPDNHKGLVTWPSLVAPDMTIEDMEESYLQMFPGKEVKAVLMGSPTCDLPKTNAYALECAKSRGVPAFYCTKWNTPVEEIEKALKDGFCGIKPYLNNSPLYIPRSEVRIFDFLTPEHMAYMDKVGGVVMLHIPRSLRLKDPVNLAQMLEINEKYPHAKVIIAHVGRAYVEEDFGNAFEVLKDAKNLYYDFTANTLDRAMEEVIRMAGPRRVLFGSDMPITKMRMYRIDAGGYYVNVVPRGLYGDVSYDKNMRETDEKDITIFMYEELMAFRRASEKLGLSKEDVADVMCHNAERVFDHKFF